MTIYTSGKEAFYDDEKLLYYCYVGAKREGMPLLAAIYGNTELRAVQRAEAFATLLNRVGAAGLIIAEPTSN